LPVTSALLSPSLALALLSATSLTPAAAYAQAANSMPPIVVEAPKPRPKPRVVRPSRTTQRAPAVNAPNPVPPRNSEGPVVPATTATISGEAAFSRGLGTSDSASLVNDIPGGAVWGAGGVSSLPAINGVGADRVQVAVNSMLISSACPNEMNPPLSFVNPAMIANMRAYLGVAPVSVGGDYIGGKIDVTTAPPQFAAGAGWQSNVMVSGFFRSISNAYGVDATATLANKDTSVTYTGGWVRASDYKAADGTKVKSTLYETQNHALSISKESFGNLFTVEVGGQFIPYQGYVNQIYGHGLQPERLHQRALRRCVRLGQVRSERLLSPDPPHHGLHRARQGQRHADGYQGIRYRVCAEGNYSGVAAGPNPCRQRVVPQSPR
jgi:iron complex outermembrane receptor protein